MEWSILDVEQDEWERRRSHQLDLAEALPGGGWRTGGLPRPAAAPDALEADAGGSSPAGGDQVVVAAAGAGLGVWLAFTGAVPFVPDDESADLVQLRYGVRSARLDDLAGEI